MAEAPLAREMQAMAITGKAAALPGGITVADQVAPSTPSRRVPVAVAPGSAGGAIRWLLRLEGGAVLALALVAYAQTGAGWVPLAVLFFVPDLSLFGYLAGPRTGALLYNAAHSYLGPLATIGVGMLGGQPVAMAAGCVWLAHIGLDRLCGFGLKYASGFANTHLGSIGRPDPW